MNANNSLPLTTGGRTSPLGTVTQRFPLVARARPACLRLPDRVHVLVDLADTAVRETDPVLASTVYNQAALIASDLNMPQFARELCHQHANAYLRACPLPGKSAVRALEPIVNLARLHIRAGRSDDGRHLLLALYQAVSTSTAAQFDGIALPSHLAPTPDDRHSVRAWLWTVLLADGTRSLTTAGRWEEALAHIEQHRGVGRRMFDGRQVAILASLSRGDPARAVALLEDTAPGEPWEQAVTACLTALCRRTVGRDAEGLAEIYTELEPERGTAVFDARLGLTVLDAIGGGAERLARRVVDELHRRTITLDDGYAARENLDHPLFTAIASESQRKNCRDILDLCALGVGRLPADLHRQLAMALAKSNRTIQECLRT